MGYPLAQYWRMVRVVDLLAAIDQREVTSLLLDMNDDINNQLLRYERYKKNRRRVSQCRGAEEEEEAALSTNDVFLELSADGQEESNTGTKALLISNIDLNNSSGSLIASDVASSGGGGTVQLLDAQAQENKRLL